MSLWWGLALQAEPANRPRSGAARHEARASRSEAILLPPLSSQERCRQARAAPEGRAPPKRSPRRPQPRGAALQRSLQVRDLLLLLQRSGETPITHRSPLLDGLVAETTSPVQHPRSAVANERCAPGGVTAAMRLPSPRPKDLYVGGCITGHGDSRKVHGTLFMLERRPGRRQPREGARQAAQPVLGAAQNAARQTFPSSLSSLSTSPFFFFSPSCSPCALVARRVMRIATLARRARMFRKKICGPGRNYDSRWWETPGAAHPLFRR